MVDGEWWMVNVYEHVNLAEILDLHLEIRHDSIKNCEGICPMMEPENTTIVNLD